MALVQNDWKALLAQLRSKVGGAGGGCSKEEIAAIEKRAGMTLPATYVEFLSEVGHSADDLFMGEDVACKDLDLVKEGLEGLAEELGVELPDEAFCFWGHQGEHFYFFSGGDVADPEVLLLAESDGEGKIDLTNMSLGEFFALSIQQALDRPPLPKNVTVYRYDR